MDIIDHVERKANEACLYECFTDNLLRLQIFVWLYYFYNEAYDDTNFFKYI